MDSSLRTRAEQLASEIAGQAKTAEDLNGLMRLMMKSALEQMLNGEMDCHLGRRASTDRSADSPGKTVTPCETATTSKSAVKRAPNRRNRWSGISSKRSVAGSRRAASSAARRLARGWWSRSSTTLRSSLPLMTASATGRRSPLRSTGRRWRAAAS